MSQGNNESVFLRVLNQHAEREELRLDKIYEQIAALREILAQQSAILDTHIQRSERLESIVETTRDEQKLLEVEHVKAISTIESSNRLIEELAAKIGPLVKQQMMWVGVAKAVAISATLLGIVGTVWKFFSP